MLTKYDICKPPAYFNCRCIFVEAPTVAEVMLRMVDAMYAQSGIIDGGGMTEANLAQLALAVALKRKPALAFRAMMERWDRDRIFRELY